MKNYFIVLVSFLYQFHSYRTSWKQKFLGSRLISFANPVSADGNSYQDVSEQDAFLWFDEAMIYVRAGSGGAGSSSMKFGKARQHVAPQGGSGGKGGDIIIDVDTSINTLLGFRGKQSYKAENGFDGESEFLNGRSGTDYRISVPKGTVIRDNSTNEIVAEMTEPDQRVVIAAGGIGGKGNAATKIERGEKAKGSPPQGGEKKILKLELKLVADVGLVGIPNAGKSSLLDAITNARPKIASYPFTTIVPNLGVCETSRIGEAMIIADIPGLLEGASQGVGLGRGFLRHIERCKIIIHIINGDSEDPIADFKAINKELLLFSPTLAKKPQIVVLNKIDLPHVALKKEIICQELLSNMAHTRLMTISAAARIGTDELVERTYSFLKKVEASTETNTNTNMNTNMKPDSRVEDSITNQ